MTLTLTTFLASMLGALGSAIFVFTSFSDDREKPLAYVYGNVFAMLGTVALGAAQLFVFHWLYHRLGEASRYWLLFLGPICVHVLLMSTLVHNEAWARCLENAHFRLAAKVVGGLMFTAGVALIPVYTLMQQIAP